MSYAGARGGPEVALLALSLCLPVGPACAQVAQPIFVQPGDVVSLPQPIENPLGEDAADNGDTINSIKVIVTGDTAFVTAATESAPQSLAPGETKTFTPTFVVGNVLDGSYTVRLKSVSPDVGIDPDPDDPASDTLVNFAIDRSSPLANLSFQPYDPPGNPTSAPIVKTVVGEFPSSPIKLSTPPALSVTHLDVSVRDLVSGIVRAEIREDGAVKFSSVPAVPSTAPIFASVALKDASLYELRAEDATGLVTIGRFYADSKPPEIHNIKVLPKPEGLHAAGRKGYTGVTKHDVSFSVRDTVWVKDARLVPKGFAATPGNWHAAAIERERSQPPTLHEIFPPGTTTMGFVYLDVPNGEFDLVAIDASSQTAALATLRFRDTVHAVSLYSRDALGADCVQAPLVVEPQARVNNTNPLAETLHLQVGSYIQEGGVGPFNIPQFLGTGVITAPIGGSGDTAATVFTRVNNIQVGLAPASPYSESVGLPEIFTLTAPDTKTGPAPPSTDGSFVSFEANAKSPMNELARPLGQVYDEAMLPVSPGDLLYGERARLRAKLHASPDARRSPFVTSITANVTDHEVLVLRTRGEDAAAGQFPISTGTNVVVRGLSPKGVPVTVSIPEVAAPGVLSLTDVAFNPDLAECLERSAFRSFDGQDILVDIAVSLPGAGPFDVDLGISEEACRAGSGAALHHVGPSGRENVTSRVDRTLCGVSGKVTSGSPFIGVLPAGADKEPPTTSLSSDAPSDGLGRVVIGPRGPSPFAPSDGETGAQVTEVRLGAGSFVLAGALSTLPEGVHSVAFRSRDRANNLEVAKSTELHVDATPPSVAITSLPPYTNNPRPTFRATFSDDLAALDTSALTFSVGGATIPAALIAASTGQLTWLTAPSLPFGVYLHSMLTSGNYLYSLGGNDPTGTIRRDVVFSTIGASGLPGPWKQTAQLPNPSQVMGAAVSGSRLYVLGGSPGGLAVSFTNVTPGGELTAWDETLPLPAALTALEGVAIDAAGSYLYAIGGQDPSNVHQDEVYVTRLDAVSGAPTGWSQTLSLPTPRAAAASCVWNGRIYILGGRTLGDVSVATVHSSSVQALGAIAGWRGETALPFPTFGARAVAVAGRIYVLGGFTNGARTDAVYSALINPDGRLGDWRPETPLHTPLYFAAAAAPAGAIYYGGGIVGSAGTADVRYALVLPPEAAPKQAELLATPAMPLGEGPHALLARGADRVANAQTAIGSITVDLTPPTVTLTAAGVELSSAAERFVTDATPVLVAAFHDATSGVDPPTARLFLDGTDVTPAPPSATLTLTPTSLAPGRHTLEARAADNAGNTVSLAAFFFIDADPPSVALTTPLPGAVYGASVPLAALFSDEGSGLDPATLGLSVDGTTYASVVRPGPGAAALEWLTAPSLPFGVYLHSMLYANGFLYTLGGVDAAGAYRTDVSLSPVGPDGVPGNWAPTTRLKTPSVVMGAASTLGRLYIMGGVPEGTTVRYAQVLSTGNLSGWEDAPPLPASLRGLEGVAVDAAGPYLYAIGGQDLDPGNAQHREVYVSPVDTQSGAPLGWSRTLDLPYALSVAASCVWNGRIYVLGGNTSGDSTVNYVRSAVIGAQGAIVRWETETPLPFPTLGARAVAVGGRVYFMGGFTQGARTDAVYSALISSTGNLGAWRPETPLHTPLYFAAAAAPAGAIYYGGGIVGSAGTADVRYALLAGGSLLASATAHGLAEGGPYQALASVSDLAGNTGSSSAAFHIDLSPPLTSLVVQGASSTAPGLVLAQAGATVTLRADDRPAAGNAGVAATYLAINDGPLSPAPARLALSPGTSLLQFWSVDALGHRESTQTMLVTLQDAQSVVAAVDGNAGISAAQAVTITTVSVANAPSVYELARDAQGLVPVFPVYYELTGGIFPTGEPALLTFYIDLTVITDTTTLSIFTFDAFRGIWVSSPILNQQFTLLSENYGVFTGELLHTSAYALMRRTILTDTQPPAVAFTFPRPDEPGLCRLAQGPVTVRGSVTDEEIASWGVVQGSVLVGSGTANADGALGVWDATGLDGAFGLTLSALDASGNTASAALDVQAGLPARVLALGGKQVLIKPRGVAAGPDRIYVADTNADRVRVFDAAGAPLAALGEKKGAAKLNKPAGLALDAAGNILVADANNKRVVKLSPAGNFLAEYGKGVLKRPMAVALSRGRVVVADAKAGQLVVFSDSGALLARVDLPPAPAGPDEDPEEPHPVALAADTAGNVWAADAKGRRVLHFTPDLTLARTIPGFERPEGVAVTPSGACLAVSDAKAARIRTFDAQLSAGLAAFGVHGEVKENRPLPTEFLLNKPAQLAFTPAGTLLVADRNNDLIQGFGLPGAPLVLAMGAPGRPGGGTRLTSAGSEDAGTAATARVGRFEGGRVEHPDGAAVEVPAGALGEDVDVAVAKAADSGDEHRAREAARGLAGLGSASAAREFSPHGLAFSEPARITLPYDPLLAGAPRELKVHYWNPARGAWEALASEVDTQARTVSARVAHFSVYQVLGPAGAFNTLADPEAGFAFRSIYAFPNPAVGGQKPTVHVSVGKADKVTVRFYDVAGTPVHEAALDTPAIVNDESGPHWAYEHVWQGHIPSGVYIYAVTAEKAGHAPIKRVGKLAVVR